MQNIIEKNRIIWYYIVMANDNESILKILSEASKDYDEQIFLMQSIEVVSDPKLYKHYLQTSKKLEQLSLLYKEYQSYLPNLVPDEFFNKVKAALLSGQNNINQKAKLEIFSKSKNLDLVTILFDMFIAFAKTEGYKIYISKNSNNSKILSIEGEGVFSKLNSFCGYYEMVVRGTTISATVFVLKEEIFDICFSDEDFEIQTSKSSGAGGQHINKTESAVVIKHKKTGLTSKCEDERSQSKNKERALENLKAKVIKFYNNSAEKTLADQKNKLSKLLGCSVPVMIFNEDRNFVYVLKLKKEYDLLSFKNGKINNLINDLRI